MKKFSKILVLTLIVIFSLTSLAFAGGVNLSLDGTVKSLDLEVKNARSFISTSSLSKLGLKAEITGNKVKASNSEVIFEFTLDSNKVKVNGVPFTLDSKAYRKGEAAYLPLRFVLETLNYKIGWDGQNKRVSAKKQAEKTYPLIIKDGENTFTVESEAKTIVSMAPGVTEKLFALGVGDRVKGRTQYCVYPNEVSEIQNIGTLYEPNLELILDIDPDIVIAETHFNQEILDQLNNAEIETVAKSSPTNIEGIYDQVLSLGAIVNKNYEARALVSSMKSKVSRVKYVLKDVVDSEKPSAYYVVGTGQWGEYTAGKGTFIADLISVAGGINAANDVEGWKYSLEKLIDNDPNIIFGNQFNIDSMVNGDSYQSLSAINNKKYVIIDQNIVELPGPRAIDEGLKKLVEMFHKDRVKNLNF